jgi:hypothetical protein
MTISRWILLRIRNAANKSCRENQNTHFIFDNFSPENCAIYDNVEKYSAANRSHKWRHNTVHSRFMLDKQGYTRANNCTRQRARARARAHTHTHACTHRRTLSYREMCGFANAPHVHYLFCSIKIHEHNLKLCSHTDRILASKNN